MVSTPEMVCTIIASSLGAFGALSFIISYSILPEIRTRSRLFILTLSSCNVICEFTGLLPGFKSQTLCNFQAFILTWFFAASCCWIFLISLIYYLQICRNVDIENSPKFYWFASLFVQLFASTQGILTLIIGEPSSGSSYWCYVSGKGVEIFHYSTVWFCLISTLFLYSLVIHKIRKDKEANYPKSFQFKMLTLALVYIVTELWLAIKRITQIIHENESPGIVVNSLQSFFSPLIGFWDFVFFVLGDKFVRALLSHKFSKKKYSNLN
ncbi:g protein-coupled receptor [Anaeramoeba ignava]|uniref:G protein-coupled receptor n=1 Tax=Anaeramoeba ignava TaxID=1746090 RepID=A0A9Q0LB72_ANAIG|nr:g protein-coupled receptor [Anaeramoeba ignava]